MATSEIKNTVNYCYNSEYLTDSNFTNSASYTTTKDGFYLLQTQNNAADNGDDLRIVIDGVTVASITLRNAYDKLIIGIPLKSGVAITFICTNTSLSCNYRITRLY